MIRITVIWLSVKKPEFFHFPKRDISTARCKCTIYIFTSKSIKIIIRTEFINMTMSLSMQAFFMVFFFLTEAEFFFKEILLVIRNFCIAPSEIELVFCLAERQCSESLFSMFLFKKMYLMQVFNQYMIDTCPLLDTNIYA